MAFTLPSRTDGPLGGHRNQRTFEVSQQGGAVYGHDPGVNVPQGAFGSGIGISIARVASQIGDDVIKEMDRQQKLTDSLESARSLIEVESGLNDELDRIRQEEDAADSTLTKRSADKARSIASKIVLPKGVSNEARELYEVRVQQRQALFSRSVSALHLRGQEAAGIALFNDYTTEAANQARRNPGSLQRQLDMLDDVAMGVSGILPTDREASLMAKGRSSIIAASIDGLIEATDTGMAKAVLNSGKFDKDLGQTTISRLRNKIDAREKEIEVQVSKQVDDAVAVLDRGRIPEGLESLKVTASDYASGKKLDEAIADQGALAKFLVQPLTAQTATIQSRLKDDPTNRREIRLTDRMMKSHTALRKQIGDGEGLIAARELGVVSDLQTIDLNDPFSLARRVSQARVAGEHFGMSVDPLLPAEIKYIEVQLDSASADSVTGILSRLTDGLGQDGALALASSLAPKRPEMAVAIMSIDRPAISRDIVLGGRLLKQNPDVKPGKPDRVLAIDNVFGNMFEGVPGAARQLDPLVAAGMALYASRRIPGGDMSFDGDTFETALRDVAGTPVSFNGRTIMPPAPGVSEAETVDLIKGMNARDLEVFGTGKPVFADGKPFTPQMFDSKWFGVEAQLISVAPGRYLVQMPGMGYVANSTGGAYVIDLRAAMERGIDE